MALRTHPPTPGTDRLPGGDAAQQPADSGAPGGPGRTGGPTSPRGAGGPGSPLKRPGRARYLLGAAALVLGLAGAGAGLVWSIDRGEQVPAFAAETEGDPAAFTVSGGQAGQEWTLLSDSPGADGSADCAVAGPGGQDLAVAPPAEEAVIDYGGDTEWFTIGAVTPEDAGEYTLDCSRGAAAGAEAPPAFTVTADSIPSGASGLPLSFAAIALPPLVGGALGGGIIAACFTARRRAA
ncbi:hypothetical protein [Nocardiopsis coralliicola]